MELIVTRYFHWKELHERASVQAQVLAAVSAIFMLQLTPELRTELDERTGTTTYVVTVKGMPSA